MLECMYKCCDTVGSKLRLGLYDIYLVVIKALRRLLHARCMNFS